MVWEEFSHINKLQRLYIFYQLGWDRGHCSRGSPRQGGGYAHVHAADCSRGQQVWRDRLANMTRYSAETKRDAVGDLE